MPPSEVLEKTSIICETRFKYRIIIRTERGTKNKVITSIPIEIKDKYLLRINILIHTRGE